MPLTKLTLGQRVWLAGDPCSFGHFVNPRTRLCDFFIQKPIEAVVKDMYLSADSGYCVERSLKTMGKRMWNLLIVSVDFVRPYKDWSGARRSSGLTSPNNCYGSENEAAIAIVKRLSILSKKIRDNVDKLKRVYSIGAMNDGRD